MKSYLTALIIILILIIGCSKVGETKKVNADLTDFVDPFIGTSHGGNQQPGSRLPFGMVHFGPVNIQEFINPKASNYVFGEPEIFGFSLVNISGSGCPNYGGILVMPGLGAIDLKNKKTEYSEEKASPGYYSVKLKKHNIKTELTSSLRCGYAKFTFPMGDANITLDLSRRHKEDSGFYIDKISETEFAGYKTDGVFCGLQGSHTIYFYAKLKTTPIESGLFLKNEISDDIRASGEELAFYAKYFSEKEQEIEIISGVSYVSIENAKENLETEIGDASFDDIRLKAENAWQEKLSRILVEGGTEKDKTKFYTAIYHTMSHPNIINDVNGEYPAMATFETKRKAPGEDRYSLYSLWDTYRNLHSFFALVYPEIQSDMVQSMVDMYAEGGWLPHWELISVEKGVMNGDPAPIVIADSYLRGIRDFDIEKAYEAMVHNAEHTYLYSDRDGNSSEKIRGGNKQYLLHNGFIPQNDEEVWGVVATTQEYNLSDWNIAQMAKVMGEKGDYEKFIQRSKGYRFFWDSETQFFRPRNEDGSYLKPFDEFEISGENSWPGSGGPGYCEGNAWHYLYFVPHDMKYLRDSIMGTDLFVSKLQTMFDSSYYKAANEPDIAFPFLFNYVKGEEWRTQKIVRELIDHEFGTGTDGIPGNDDTGTMSTWLIFAMMGFYPDCPGSMDYQISTPVFDKITIALNPNYYSGEEFVIETKNSATENHFIAKMQLNGKDYYPYTIKHEDIVKGGSLLLELSNLLDNTSKPNKK